MNLKGVFYWHVQLLLWPGEGPWVPHYLGAYQRERGSCRATNSIWSPGAAILQLQGCWFFSDMWLGRWCTLISRVTGHQSRCSRCRHDSERQYKEWIGTWYIFIAYRYAIYPHTFPMESEEENETIANINHSSDAHMLLFGLGWGGRTFRTPVNFWQRSTSWVICATNGTK